MGISVMKLRKHNSFGRFLRAEVSGSFARSLFPEVFRDRARKTDHKFCHDARREAALALQRTGSVSAALAERNPRLSPHLSFMDAGGHG
jgi:hypothetical protein